MVLGPCATALGFTMGLWLAAARAERMVHGAVNDRTVRDWLPAVNDRVQHPERCGQPSDPDRHAGPWGGVPVLLLLLQTVVVEL